MTEALPTAGPPPASESLHGTWRLRRAPRGPRPRLVLLVLLFAAFGARSLGAHEIIDIEQANALVVAAEEAVARTKTTAGPGADGDAQFALGVVLVEVTDVLNRDLAAHSGRLTVNAELMLKALAQQNLAPRFDEAIGRYRMPRTPLEDALRFSPEAPYALRARFALLKAGFYESFVLNPFELVGIGFNDLERQITEAAALASTISSSDDAEEAAFIHAVDLARAARLASQPEAMRAYAGEARTALGAFAKAYPDSMRAAAAGMILKGLGGTE